MGATSPWLSQVRTVAAEMPRTTEVLVGVSDMARVMADSDLAIGAAGSTSWERCCLGLPSIVLILADNQRFISSQLDQAGAAVALQLSVDGLGALHRPIEEYSKSENLARMSAAASKVCDGLGTQRIGNQLYEQ
jgi:spore coat polysaccharide biosynthesis predicted glycosyltransferase SpsG